MPSENKLLAVTLLWANCLLTTVIAYQLKGWIRRSKMKKAILSVLLKLVLAVLAFFVVTFTVYFFNLDMKATSLLAPLLEKWYDNLDRKQYI